MCKICIDWQLGKLTIDEAWRNVHESADIEYSTGGNLDHLLDLAERLFREDEKPKS
jgi:hypothetical protein